MKMDVVRKWILILTIGAVGFVVYRSYFTGGAKDAPAPATAPEKSAPAEKDTTKSLPRDTTKEETPKSTDDATPKGAPKGAPAEETPKETPKAPEEPKETLDSYTSPQFMATSWAKRGVTETRKQFLILGGKITEKRFQEPIIQHLTSNSDDLASYALTYISLWKSDAKIFVPDIVSVLETRTGRGEDRFRLELFQKLSYLGKAGKPAIPTMVKLIGEEKSTLRREVMTRYMADMVLEGPMAYSALVDLESSGDDLDREAIECIFSVFDRETLRGYEGPPNKKAPMRRSSTYGR